VSFGGDCGVVSSDTAVTGGRSLFYDNRVAVDVAGISKPLEERPMIPTGSDDERSPTPGAA
jgi:hypothetical protein